MQIYVGLIVLCIVGLVVFLMAKANPDAKRIGEIVFACALLALCFGAGPIGRLVLGR